MWSKPVAMCVILGVPPNMVCNMPRHSEVLKLAIQTFADVHGRWPRSIEELDPYGMRNFGRYQLSGFNDATESEIKLRYVHRTGKSVVCVSRITEESSGN